MDKIGAAVSATVIFLLILVVAFPIVSDASDTSLEGSNADPLYFMGARALTDTTVIAMEDGVLTIDGEPVTGMGLTGTVMLMSDVLTMAIDADAGTYTAWSILLDGQSCMASSEEDAGLVYTFSRAHLTITDADDPEFSESSWYRYLLVPASSGDLGVWSLQDLPTLVLDASDVLYVSGASGSDAGTVYGPLDNIASGQCIADGARSYGSAAAIYGPVLNGSAFSVSSFDTYGGIVGDHSYVVCDTSYTYNTETGQAVQLILSAAAIMIFLIAIAAIIKVLK